jgi:hypothetical protein
MRGLLFAVFAGFIACGCAAQQIETASQIRVNDDQFLPYKEYSTGTLWNFDSKAFTQVSLGARQDRKSGILQTLLEFTVAYSTDSRYNYKNARNNKAEQLTLTALRRRSHNCNRKEDTCDHREILQVTIPEAELRQAPAEGYQVKLFAAVGPPQLITIPKPLIVSLLAKVDADRGTPGNVAAAAPAAAAGPAPVAPAKPVASAAH